MNPADLFKMKQYWETFCSNHPRFPQFLQAARNGMVSEGSVIDVTITSADGRTISTNVKLTQSDMDMFRALGNMK